MLTMSTLLQEISAVVVEADLGLYGIIAFTVVLLIMMGTILDSVSIMVAVVIALIADPQLSLVLL